MHPRSPEEKENQIIVDIGLMLKTFIKKRKIHKSALARKLNKSYTTLVFYLKKPSIHIEVLLEISLALKHNFFADIAALLPKDFTTEAIISTEKEEQMALLEKEILMLKAERDVLMQLLKK